MTLSALHSPEQEDAAWLVHGDGNQLTVMHQNQSLLLVPAGVEAAGREELVVDVLM